MNNRIWDLERNPRYLEQVRSARLLTRCYSYGYWKPLSILLAWAETVANIISPFHS